MRNASRLQLRNRARFLSYTLGDTSIDDDDLNESANVHYPNVYEELVAAGPPERFAATQSITTTAGLAQVPLSVDFLSLLDVYVIENGIRTNLLPMRTGTLGNYRAPATALNLEIEYIPACPTLDSDGDTLDGVSGFEDLIANLMAKDILMEREGDLGGVMAEIARLRGRIVRNARGYDKGYPKRVTDLDEMKNDWWFLETGGPRRRVYRLRGQNLEIYESLGAYP